MQLPVRSVRLVASAATIEDRLRRRYTPDQSNALDWHLRYHHELSARLERAALDEAVVPTDDRTPADIAATILSHFRFPLERTEPS